MSCCSRAMRRTSSPWHGIPCTRTCCLRVVWMAAYTTTSSTSRIRRQALRLRYRHTTLRTLKTPLRKPYTLHTASNTHTTLLSGPWTGTRSAISSRPAPTIASHAFGHARDQAIQTTSMTGITLAKPPPKPKARLTAARGGDKRWRKKSKRPKTKPKVSSTKNCLPRTLVLPSFHPASRFQASAHLQTALQALSQASGAQTNLPSPHHPHQQACPFCLNQTLLVHPCPPSLAWTRRASHNSSPRAPYRRRLFPTAMVLPLQTETVLLRLLSHPRQTFLVSLRECPPVCLPCRLECLHRGFRASLRLPPDWVLRRPRDGRVLCLPSSSSRRHSNRHSSSKGSMVDRQE